MRLLGMGSGEQMIEHLEARRLLADTLTMYTWGGDANSNGTVNGDDYGTTFGSVNVTGTAKGDRIVIFNSPDAEIGISVNGHVTEARDASGLKIFGNAGNDVIVIDLGVGNSVPT